MIHPIRIEIETFLIVIIIVIIAAYVFWNGEMYFKEL
jgi:hypothetical protein